MAGCGSSVTLVGVGALGSHAVPLIARVPGVQRCILIDPDSYDQGNLLSQDICCHDVGRSKVSVGAKRMRRINPGLSVEAIVAPVEAVPLGKLRGGIIVACVDTRSARQIINQRAWRLNIPWIDAAVDADGNLLRVGVYVPGPDAPCLECAWGDGDYALLEHNYSCRGTGISATAAPAELGALAAALQVTELRKLLRQKQDSVLVGRQMVMDTMHHRHYTVGFQRNPRCRFNHQSWNIRPLPCNPEEMSIAHLFRLFRQHLEGEHCALRVEDHTFIKRLTCLECGRWTRPMLRLSGRPSKAHRICRYCGGRLAGAGLDSSDAIDATSLSAAWLGRPLARLGLRVGDIVSVDSAQGQFHYEIGGYQDEASGYGIGEIPPAAVPRGQATGGGK